MKPPDLVTIAEIVQHAGMTPAAFYYHFPSRTSLFQEVVSRFGDGWAQEAEQQWGDVDTREGVLEVAVGLLDRALEERPAATIFFVTSKGASIAVEALRRGVLTRAAAAAAGALQRSDPGAGGARCALDGVALISTLDASLRAELSLDPTYRTLGPRRFRDEVLDLAARVVGPPTRARGASRI